MDRRAFLGAGLAGGALAWTGAAWARGRLDASATRLSADSLRLEWTEAAAPVTILVSPDPDAPRRAMRPAKAGARGGRAEIAGPVSPRPYFLIEGPGGPTRVAERLLPLKGGRNFRDLGGYRGAEDRQVRWGRIYRSGVMAGLTAEDLGYLRGLGVAVICDLRSVRERAAEPSPFLKAGGVRVAAFDYDLDASMEALTRARTRDEAVGAFAAAYVDFTERLAPQYADLFARLLANEGPLAMNCSAGKDRTGMGSALVLSVLGVPRETVLADYALTQVYTPPATYMRAAADPSTPNPAMTADTAKAMSRLPPEVLQVIMGSDPEVMSRALTEIDRRHGGPIGLAKTRYGLTDAAVTRLRRLYLA